MVSLTEAVAIWQKALRKLAIAVSIVVLLIVLIIIGKNIKNALIPPPPQPATVAFGKLPKIDFSEGVKTPSNINYTIETISGDLPQLPSKLKVFEVVENDPSFGALEQTKIIAARLKFEDNPKEVISNTAKFIDPREDGRNLTIDIVNGNFKLETDYVNNLDIISKRPRSIEDTIKETSNFFANFGINTKDFPSDKVETKTYRIDGGNLVETPALTNANLVRVNFLRADIDGTSVINPKAEKVPAWALVSDRKIVEAELWQLPIAKHRFSTYPLKSASKAFEDLKAGKGAFNKALKNNSFPIRDVYLAYLETKNHGGFLQPVYVFKNDDELIAYVAAVDNQWAND